MKKLLFMRIAALPKVIIALHCLLLLCGLDSKQQERGLI